MSEESKATTFGARVKEVREEQGISIEDAAGRVGLGVGIWTDIEENQCNPKLRTIWLIANALDVRVHNLMV